MFCNRLSHTIKDAFKIIEFTCILYFHNDDITLAVFSLDIYSVEFIVNGLLVTFTFQQLDDFNLFVQQHGKEAFQHSEISFLTQKTFDGPVKADITIFHKAIRLNISMQI